MARAACNSGVSPCPATTSPTNIELVSRFGETGNGSSGCIPIGVVLMTTPQPVGSGGRSGRDRGASGVEPICLPSLRRHREGPVRELQHPAARPRSRYPQRPLRSEGLEHPGSSLQPSFAHRRRRGHPAIAVPGAVLVAPTLLTAPDKFEVTEAVAQYLNIVILCGIVTSIPRTFETGAKPSSRSRSVPSGTSIGTHTPLWPRSASLVVRRCGDYTKRMGSPMIGYNIVSPLSASNMPSSPSGIDAD
jgi:hypothetical protein